MQPRKLIVHAPVIHGSTLDLLYELPNATMYTYSFSFNKDIESALSQYPKERVNKLLNFIALGNAVYLFNTDYYQEIEIKDGLSNNERAFFEDFYFSGLAEFRVQNQIPIHTKTTVTCQADEPFSGPAEASKLEGGIVANGGGKDGAVGSEISWRILKDVSWFTWNLKGSRKSIIEASHITSSVTATSSFSPSPYENPTFTGHKPLNGPLAFLLAFAALIDGKKYAIISNEFSANEENLVVDGIKVNHQYTKSFEIEKSLHTIIADTGLGIYYFSILRPLYELQIMQIFNKFPQYHSLFVSCNKGAKDNTWCLDCAKCAFIVLAATAVDPHLARNIWGSELFIEKPELRNHILALISEGIDKPFECVGTLEECQLAAAMIVNNDDFAAKLKPSFLKDLQQHAAKDELSARAAIMLNVEREENFPKPLRSHIQEFYKHHLTP